MHLDHTKEQEIRLVEAIISKGTDIEQTAKVAKQPHWQSWVSHVWTDGVSTNPRQSRTSSIFS